LILKKLKLSYPELGLLSAFHELGICLWFQDHDYLRKIVILNPSWATNSAYSVLQNETVKTNKGYFSKEDLKTIWCEDCYVEMRGELLDLMKKFELCYELPQKDHFIAPQLLENKPPKDYSFDPENALYVYYKYDKFMPKGILHRLMVVLHEKIANNRQSVWLTGVLFEKDHAKAQVIEKYADCEIEIRVIGNLNEKRDLMSIILEQLDRINDSFNRNHQLQVDKLIPCQCVKFKDDPEFFKYKKLCGFANKSRQIQCQKTDCYEMLNAQALLDGISSKLTKNRSETLSEENQQLLEEKIAFLENALIKETKADERFRLENEIKELKKNSSF
jgi:internalin A